MNDRLHNQAVVRAGNDNEEELDEDKDNVDLRLLDPTETARSKVNAQLIERAVDIQISYLMVSMNLSLDGLSRLLIFAFTRTRMVIYMPKLMDTTFEFTREDLRKSAVDYFNYKKRQHTREQIQEDPSKKDKATVKNRRGVRRKGVSQFFGIMQHTDSIS